jgi:hypothetical protein
MNVYSFRLKSEALNVAVDFFLMAGSNGYVNNGT